MSGDDFAGRAVVITGGAQGIGRACAEMFLAGGARVALLDLDAGGVTATATELGCTGLPCDVADAEAVAHAFATAEEAIGPVDVLVNNAGIGEATPTDRVAPDTFTRVIDVVLKGTLLCSQQAARAMLPERRGGIIINMASMMGLIAFPNRAAYCSAKAGVVALTEVCAAEWAPYGVRVNAVAPGFIKTAIMDNAVDAGVFELDRMVQWTPAGRIGTAAEVADTVRFLASDQSAYISGQTLVIDGGFTKYTAWWPPAERRA